MNLGAREEEKDAQLRFLDLVSWGGGTFELEMLGTLQVGLAFSHQPEGGFRGCHEQTWEGNLEGSNLCTGEI
jgi:hypothetical protein